MRTLPATLYLLLEPFINAITRSEIRSCMGKLFDVCGEKERQAREEKRRITEKFTPLFVQLSREDLLARF